MILITAGIVLSHALQPGGMLQQDGTVPGEYSAITDVVEPRTGVVWIADRLERTVWEVTAGGQRRPLLPEGPGPEELGRPARLLRTRSGFVVADAGNRRLTFLTREGVVTRGVPSRHAGAPNGIITPTDADTLGGLYWDARGVIRIVDGVTHGGGPEVPVVRWSARTGGIDSVARIAVRPLDVGARPTTGAMLIRAAYPAEDWWAVSDDGWIAIVRAEPYQVDWVRPDGSRFSHPPIPYERERITATHRRAWAQMVGSGAPVVTFSDGRESRSSQMATGTVRESDFEFPEYLPPVAPNGVAIDPRGRAWIRRYGAADVPARFDVVGRDGSRREALLPPGRRIVGFGERVLYAIREDPATGLQYVERYVVPD